MNRVGLGAAVAARICIAAAPGAQAADATSPPITVKQIIQHCVQSRSGAPCVVGADQRTIIVNNTTYVMPDGAAGALQTAYGALGERLSKQERQRYESLLFRLGSIEKKIDQISADVHCSGATAQALLAAITGLNATRSTEQLKCAPELLADSSVRQRLSELFGRESFARSKAYLQAMRSAGVDFIGQFPEPDQAIGASFTLYTPLGMALDALAMRSLTALADHTVQPPDPAPLAWLLTGSNASTLRGYPTLAKVLVDRLLYTEGIAFLVDKSKPFDRLPAGWSEDVQTIRQLRSAGMPVDAGDHEAFRATAAEWLHVQFPMPPLASGYPDGFLERVNVGRSLSIDERQYIDARWAPYLQQLADAVAPADESLRLATLRKTAAAFAQARVKVLDIQIARVENALLQGDANDAAHRIPVSRLRDDLAYYRQLRNALAGLPASMHV